MNILRACYDWRVLTALAGAGVGIYLIAPGLLAAALPILLLAACPLSMLLMMKAMSGPSAGAQPSVTSDEDRVAVLRRELTEVSRRQEALAAELRAVEVSRAGANDADAASVPMPSR